MTVIERYLIYWNYDQGPKSFVAVLMSDRWLYWNGYRLEKIEIYKRHHGVALYTKLSKALYAEFFSEI